MRSRRSVWFTLGFVAICLTMFSGIAALGSAPDRSDLAHSYDNLLRLHVLAHSDQPQDQQVKLLVRDALIAEMAGWPTPADRSSLEERLLKNKPRLEELAVETLRREGFAHAVQIEVGSFQFPEKRWGTALLPAGEYRAVRVVIGDGAGQNWWCVLFPPLCFVEDAAGNIEIAAGERPTAPALNNFVWTAEAKEPIEAELAADESERELGASALLEIAQGKEKKRVEWRLRLWESVSESVFAGALRDLLDVAIGRVEER